MSKVYAHRGASGYTTENTMEAFKMAKKMQSDGIEFDVHLSLDGVLFVHHDFDLGRVTKAKGKVKDLPYEELKKIEFKHDTENKFYIPTFREVLDFCNENDLEMNIELKAGSSEYPGIEEKLLKEIEESGAKKDNIILSSFDLEALTNLKDIGCDIKTGALFDNNNFEEIISFAKINKLDAIHPNVKYITAQAILPAKEAGLMVNCYTANTPIVMRKMYEAGCDIIISNYPNALRKIVSSSL